MGESGGFLYLSEETWVIYRHITFLKVLSQRASIVHREVVGGDITY